jgi:carboxyl-terminal processing protease
MRYYTPKGRAIQVQGITPNVAVDTQLSSGGDLTVLREEDLENHLSGEGEGRAPLPESIDAGASNESSAELGLGPTHLGVARTIPEDPRGGPDLALSVGYELLLERRPPLE